MFRRHLFWILALAVLVPAAASAQWGPQSRVGQSRVEPAYEEGYQRGLRAGSDDMRRGAAFNFSINVDFRRGDLGYRAQFGNRERYRDEFRRAFELGYRAAYNERRNDGYGRYDDYGRGLPGNRQGPPPPWAGGRAGGRFDVATQQGYSDGYEAGLDDARDGRRFDPVSERRYRSADRGYNATYGPRERYKTSYRTGFLSGYESAYQDASRYRRGW
jgi:hypothetical protein